MTQTVLLSAPYLIPFMDRFQPVFADFGVEVIVAPVAERLEEEDILAHAGQFDGAICGDDRYTARVIEACAPRLKVISKWGTGIDSLDKEAAARFGVAIMNTPDAFTVPVSDTVLGYILAFARRQPWMDKAMKAGMWDKIPGRTLHECTLGIIGVGRIGKAIARKAKAFGMPLLGTDIIEVSPGFLIETGMEMTSLDDLLARSDFVSLNCDLNPTSRGLVNAGTLAKAKPGSVFINTSRGPVVVEKDLIAALQSGQIGGAALDVFEFEPLPADSPLKAMDNVMLAPHNANSSATAWERVHWNTIHNLFKGLGLAYQDLDPAKYS